MITYSINKQKPFKGMSKLEFAKYVSSLPFKKGDFVVSQYAHDDVSEYGVYRVVDIQEIHSLADYEVVDGSVIPRPLTLQVIAKCGGVKFSCRADTWKLAPKFVLERYAHLLNNA